MSQEYISLENTKKIANYDKLLAENTMLKSNDILNKQKLKDLNNKHKKELEEKDKKIKELEERLSSLEYKQVDIFNE